MLHEILREHLGGRTVGWYNGILVIGKVISLGFSTSSEIDQFVYDEKSTKYYTPYRSGNTPGANPTNTTQYPGGTLTVC